MRRFVVFTGVAVLAVAGGAAYWLDGRAEPAPKYRLAKVESGPIVSVVTASGTVNAVVTVQVGSQLSGNIRELLADFNSRVKAGDPIARLDADMIEARLRQAEADLASARASMAMQSAQIDRARAEVQNAAAASANVGAQAVRAEIAFKDAERENQRKQDLLRRNVGSQADADRAQAALDSARSQQVSARAQTDAAAAAEASAAAALKVAEAQLLGAQAQVAQREAQVQQVQVDLDRSTVRSPIDGVVIQRNVDVGQTVAASLQAPTLFTIAQDLRQMEVYASVDEADVGRVAEEQPTTFTVSAFPNVTFNGQVAQVRLGPQTVQNVVTYTVVIAADNPDLRLKPGMTANIRIITDRRDGALKVPNAALRYRPPGTAAPGAAPEAAGPAPAGRGGPGSLDAYAKNLTEKLKLTAEQQQQLGEVIADAKRQFAALAGAELEADQRRARAQSIRQGMARRIEPLLTAEQRPAFAEMIREARARAQGGGAMAAGQVWVVGPDGQPQAVPVRAGISDGTMTEIVGIGLTAGQDIVIGGGRPAGAAASGGLRLGF